MQGMAIPHLQPVDPITPPPSRLYRFLDLSLVTIENDLAGKSGSTLAVQAHRIVANYRGRS
jgi:hypothetical protein